MSNFFKKYLKVLNDASNHLWSPKSQNGNHGMEEYPIEWRLKWFSRHLWLKSAICKCLPETRFKINQIHERFKLRRKNTKVLLNSKNFIQISIFQLQIQSFHPKFNKVTKFLKPSSTRFWNSLNFETIEFQTPLKHLVQSFFVKLPLIWSTSFVTISLIFSVKTFTFELISSKTWISEGAGLPCTILW